MFQFIVLQTLSDCVLPPVRWLWVDNKWMESSQSEIDNKAPLIDV